MALDLGGIGQSFAAGNVPKTYFDAYYRAKTFQNEKAKQEQNALVQSQRAQLEQRGLDLQERRLGLQERELDASDAEARREAAQRDKLAALYMDGDTVPETRETTGLGRIDSGPLTDGGVTQSLTPMQRDDAGLLLVAPDSSRSDLIFRAHQTAEKYGLDPAKFVGMIQAESGFKNQAQSPENTRNRGRAQGLGQIIPGTQKMLGLDDPFDPAANLDAAARYLVDLGGAEAGRRR